MSRDIVKVPPSAIQWRLSVDMETAALDHDMWSRSERHLVATTEKYQSIVQRYVEGRQWEDTSLFQQIYRKRLTYESVRGCTSMAALIAQYHSRVDAMFEDMKAHGWRRVVDGRLAQPILVYVGHDNELLMGNQGNHRLAMAKVLGLDHVVVEIIGRHPESTQTDLEPVNDIAPDLPDSARAIPAMTTEAERLSYYKWTLDRAPHGAVVELGAWLGASSAFIAAGMRDAGVATKAQVYDRFVWKPSSHDKKAGGAIGVSQLQAFRNYLGPLLSYVDVHSGEVTKLVWRGGEVALLICDAPKRVPEIASVLGTFATSLKPGAIMAWQDFGYFPSYDIPAAMMRLEAHVDFVEAIYPGTTAVFRVTTPWTGQAVSAAALALNRWTPDEVEARWDQWSDRLPEPMRPRFACGAAMFLCDLGAVDRAKRRLSAIVEQHPDEVLPKWRYLIAERASLMTRYRPLVEVVKQCA